MIMPLSKRKRLKLIAINERFHPQAGHTHIHKTNSERMNSCARILLCLYLSQDISELQPRYWEGGEAIAHKASYPPCPFHPPFPSYCGVAPARRYFASNIDTS
jgi:hypothetical protein